LAVCTIPAKSYQNFNDKKKTRKNDKKFYYKYILKPIAKEKQNNK